jgi:crotonobetaine/carnitine-CoA ligase
MMTSDEVFAEMVASGDVALYKLDECAALSPDKTFIYYGETGTRLSFAEVKRRADALAGGLASIGVRPGDRVSVLTGNSLAAALAMFAAWRAGAIYAPVNFNLRGKLLSYQLNDTRPAVLITDPSFTDALSAVLDEIQVTRIVVHPTAYGAVDRSDGDLAHVLGGRQVYELSDLIESGSSAPEVPLGPFDPAAIIYTSGTTGPAKGVVLGFRWINQYTFIRRTQHTHDDVIYCDLPLYHVAGAFSLFARALWHGNTVGLWDRFSPKRFWDRIEECGATSCTFLDVMVPWLMSVDARPSDRANTLNKVHMQPLAANHHEVAQRFGFDFITCGFGQTESGAGFHAVIDQFGNQHGTPPALYRGLSKDEYLSRARRYGAAIFDGSKPTPKGLMGRPSRLLEVAILDDDDNQVPPGTVGQLAFRPRFPGLLLKEYFNKPEATVKALRNLWFHTGDACVEGEDGTYRFVDRMGGFFRVRGENVSSYEVESLIASHTSIRAVAAVPVPARVGSEEEIAVFIELEEGQTLSEAEVHEFAHQHMPKYMRPTHVRFIEALPVTPTNKIQKYKLRELLLSELGRAQPA